MAGSLASRTLARPSFEAAFGATAFLRAMLAFESALAQAQAAEGLIPAASAAAIGSACQRIRIDEEALVAEGKRSATLAVPLVNRLREELKGAAPRARAGRLAGRAGGGARDRRRARHGARFPRDDCRLARRGRGAHARQRRGLRRGCGARRRAGSGRGRAARRAGAHLS